MERRDAHLIGPGFFDVRRHPEMVFRSASALHRGEEGFRMTGELTIRGVTRPVDLQLDCLGSVMDPFGYERAGFDGTTTIDRTEWGPACNRRLKNGAVVSEKVRLQFGISAVRASSQPPRGPSSPEASCGSPPWRPQPTKAVSARPPDTPEPNRAGAVRRLPPGRSSGAPSLRRTGEPPPWVDPLPAGARRVDHGCDQ
ncbi:hypothetical protein GCM10010266_70740 [Streptomyces griseomycini]|nr:hypothetical protein GCM10010266_70740 [Streptomyces griseomycini]